LDSHDRYVVIPLPNRVSFLHYLQPISTHDLKRAFHALLLYGRTKVIPEKNPPDKENQANLPGTGLGHSQN